MDNVTRDDAFTVNNVLEDKFLFWGLSPGTPIWNRDEFSKYSHIAVSSLSNRRKDILISNNSQLIDKLGAKRFQEICIANQNRINLNNATLLEIANVIDEYRYLFLARIDNDKTWEYSDYNKNESVFTVRRQLTIHTEIYDLKTLKLVWSGNINTDMSNKKSNTHHSSSNPIKDLTYTVLEDKVYGTHPPPPSIEKLINRYFARIGDSLPNKSCSELGFFYCVKRSFYKN